MKKLLVSLTALLIAISFTAKPAFADCVGQYGEYAQPCPSYAIVVDKMVGKPNSSTDASTNSYVDNLGVNDPRFSAGQIVFFKIKVKNTSTTKLVGMEVRDTVPSYLDPVDGPGVFNTSSREIVWNAGDFAVDEEKVFYMKMRVVAQASMPADKGLFCVTNYVKATSSGAFDDDTASLCIEKQVTAKTVPSTGPEFGYILVAGEMALAAAGMYLRKKS